MTNKERLKHYLSKEKRNIVFAILFCALFVICQITQPFLLGRALDTVSDNDFNLFVAYLVICTSLSIVGAVFYYIFEVILLFQQFYLELL